MGPSSAWCPLDFIAGAAPSLPFLLTVAVFSQAGWASEITACHLVSPKQALPEGPVSPGGVQQVCPCWGSVRANSSGTVRKEPVCREWYSKTQSSFFECRKILGQVCGNWFQSLCLQDSGDPLEIVHPDCKGVLSLWIQQCKEPKPLWNK